MKWKMGILIMLLSCVLTACGSKEGQNPPAEPSVTQAAKETKTPTQVPEPTAEPTPEPTATSTPKPTATPKPTEVPAIKEIFAQHNMKAGTCMSYHMMTTKKTDQMMKQHFNSITFENELKPDAILNQKESQAAGDIVVKFNSNTLEMLEWCKTNDMAVRGHTLIWHSQTPNWIFHEGFDTNNARASRDVMLARMESYIKQVFEQLESLGYLDMFYAYDVVNEAWIDNGTMRPESMWLQTIGDDYLWHAFYFADKYAPEHVDLYYNDFNEQIQNKPEALYNFFQTLKDENGEYLIDGIGFQAHLYTEDSLEDYFATVDKLSTLGLKINLTELDVSLGTWQNIKYASDEVLREQGRFYYNLINGLFARVDAGTLNMDALTFWGFADKLSWRAERNPLLFNSLYLPKYSLYGALQIRELAGFDE